MTAWQVAGVVMMAVGALGVLRAAIIVGGGGSGRFRLDPWLSLAVGCCLVLIGQVLVR